MKNMEDLILLERSRTGVILILQNRRNRNEGELQIMVEVQGAAYRLGQNRNGI